MDFLTMSFQFPWQFVSHRKDEVQSTCLLTRNMAHMCLVYSQLQNSKQFWDTHTKELSYIISYQVLANGASIWQGHPTFIIQYHKVSKKM